MTIYFSEIFKKLRKGRSMTQEQVAEVLSVSPQAVSRWETGATYPDIALLPSIAEFFETTVDALLGTGKARAKERIDGFLRHGQELCEAGDVLLAVDLMRSAVREFPNSYELQYALLETLLLSDESGSCGAAAESEITELGERILTYSTDDRLRLLTKVHLGRYLAKVGRTARATEIFMTLPEAEYCREKQLKLTGIEVDTEDPEGTSSPELSVDAAVLALFAGMRRASREDGPKKRLSEAKRRLQLLDSIYAEKDYDGYYLENAAICTADMAEAYAENGDGARALLCLSKAIECALETTSEPLSDSVFSDHMMLGGPARPLKVQIEEDLLSKPCFDALKGDPSFPHLPL